MSQFHVMKLNRKRWAAVRRKVLDRDGWRCVRCAGYGRLEVDHVRPIKGGGDHGIDPYDETNLQTLCRACHIEKTALENRREQSPAAKEWRGLVLELMTE